MKNSIIKIDNKKYELEWHKDTNFDNLDNITQVYGYIFNDKGELLIVNPKTTWRLPGGHPEGKDKNFEQTLIREADEEADVDIKNIIPLGYIKVVPLDKNTSEKIHYLLRYVAKIKSVKKQTIDIAEGIINDRKFINVKDFSKYCAWGEMGEGILSEAIALNQKPYIFIDKTLFFPKSGILAVGDLHLGYEHMLKASGISIPEMQIKEMMENLKKIFSEIKNRGYKIKKIIFLGDIKHYFGFEFHEKGSFDDVYAFLRKHFEEKDIILIKGNHDKSEYSGKRMRNYYINDGIAFIHGHIDFFPIYDKEIKTIVIGHLHPSVIISDKANVKREKFKCFLVGKMKGKELIVLPSFFEIIEGTSVNDYEEDYQRYFSIIPKESLMNSEIFVVGEDSVYDFGKVHDLD